MKTLLVLSLIVWMHGTTAAQDVSPDGDTSNLRPYYTGSCVLCPAGRPGPPGPPGPQGVPGRDGRDGRDGENACCNGENGGGDGDGDGGNGGNGGGGATYVRWGRTECTSNSELVYSGFAAGGRYTHKGSGSNYLCMPEEPIYDEPQAGTGGNRAILYASEYEMNTFPPWEALHDNNVPCAVCRARRRSSLLMVPARNVCPSSGWTTEYAGYLVASYHNQEGRSEFVCMDRDAEVVPSSQQNDNGALFYPTDFRCGSSDVNCPSYVTGNELTCAVCTR